MQANSMDRIDYFSYYSSCLFFILRSNSDDSSNCNFVKDNNKNDTVYYASVMKFSHTLTDNQFSR
jgi:hypothetical protein